MLGLFIRSKQRSENIFTFIRLCLIFSREECFLEHDFLNFAEAVVKVGNTCHGVLSYLHLYEKEIQSRRFSDNLAKFFKVKFFIFFRGEDQ